MSYYHHGGEFQQDTDLSTETTEPVPSWETLDPQPPQHPQDSPSDSHSAFVSPAAPTPHALPPQHFDYSPLHTPVEYADSSDFLFPSQQAGPSMLVNFAPQERLVRSEGYPSPENEAFQPSPSPTTPTVAGPQRTTRPRPTVVRGSSRVSNTQLQHHHPYRRPQSALARRETDTTGAGAKFTIMTGGGIQSYPASMSAPARETRPSQSSPSTLLSLPTSRPQGPSPVSIPASSHQPMGPPPEPSHPSPLAPVSQPRFEPATIPPSSAIAPNTDFENGVRRIRATTKHFFTPRLDSFYDINTRTLEAHLELPGVLRENLYVTLADSAITRHRNLNVWGFSLSPTRLRTGVPSAGASTSGASQEASSMTGTTIQMSSGSLSSTSDASVPSMSAGEAAGSAQGSSAPSRDSGAGVTVTSAMELSLGLGLPPQYTSRERRYGEFYRLLPVPPETRATHVQAVLEAGVLSLLISFGQTLTEEQVGVGREVITVR